MDTLEELVGKLKQLNALLTQEIAREEATTPEQRADYAVIEGQGIGVYCYIQSELYKLFPYIDPEQK